MNNLPEKYQWYNCICRHFSMAENIPVLLLDHEDVISIHPHFTLGVSLQHELLTDFNINPRTISIAETKGHLLMGLLWIHKDSTCSILVGPVKTYKASDNDYISLLPDKDSLDEDASKELNSYIHASPVMSYRQLYHKLAMLNFIVNGEESESLAEHSAQVMPFLDTLKEDQEKERFRRRESGIMHNTYRYERDLMRGITLGDQERVKKALNQIDTYVSRPQYSPNEMRTLKNDFIITATLVSRAAIGGGLDMETALQLSDSYIIAAEQCDTMEKIHNLSASMISDYCQRMSHISLPRDTPAMIVNCVNYINANITRAITTQSVADHFGIRREYLSTQMKKYAGYPVSEFIMRQRIENAKALLQYTNIPLTQISFHLCFSDQSHFQRLFKKYTGLTPTAFRKMMNETA